MRVLSRYEVWSKDKAVWWEVRITEQPWWARARWLAFHYGVEKVIPVRLLTALDRLPVDDHVLDWIEPATEDRPETRHVHKAHWWWPYMGWDIAFDCLCSDLQRAHETLVEEFEISRHVYDRLGRPEE